MRKQKKIVIYCDQLSGHYLEYIHHIHEGAYLHSDVCYIFVVSEKIQDIKSELTWSKSDNIIYHFLSEKDIIESNSIIVKSYRKSRLIKKIVQQYTVDEIFFISIMGFLPMITFLLPKGIKISGIVYLIYLYRWKEAVAIQKISDCIKYLLLSKRSNFKNIFILNDKSSAKYLNWKYNSTKFIYLPDPYLPIDISKTTNVRKNYSIPEANIVCLHFGGLAERKGTLKILEAIELLNENELKNKTFIFAGKINADIKEQFYEKYNNIKFKVQVLCFDEFCEYTFLASLTLSSDYILLPYSNTAQSSGIIGYGAQFNIPVIVPMEGLLGKLVRKYNLGYPTDITTSDRIANFIKTTTISSLSKSKKSKYIIEHTISEFTDVIFKEII